MKRSRTRSPGLKSAVQFDSGARPFIKNVSVAPVMSEMSLGSMLLGPDRERWTRPDSAATEHDGKTFYFCGDHCRQKFLSMPAGAKPAEKSGGCCG